MGRVRGLLLTFLTVIATGSGVLAEEAPRWESSIDAAKRLATQSHRLVVVVFSAPWCTHCREMENEALGEPAVVAALQANYVPAKLNVDYYRGTAGQYGVSLLPTTIILAPGGQPEVLAIIRGKISAAELAAKLNQVAANTRPRAPTVSVNIPAREPAGPPISPIRPAAPALTLSNPVPQHPPFGLDGFSPILLVEKKAWVPGDPRWGVVHRNRTYLFASQEEQRRFLENDNADRYAPVNSGDDVVLRVEQGRSVPGLREHGIVYADHVYLFADETTLEKFSKNPRFFAERAVQAMRTGTWK